MPGSRSQDQGEGELVPGLPERQGGDGDGGRGGQGKHDTSETLPERCPVDAGRLLDVTWDLLDEADQEPHRQRKKRPGVDEDQGGEPVELPGLRRQTVERNHGAQAGDEPGEQHQEQEQVPAPEPETGEGVGGGDGQQDGEEGGAESDDDAVPEGGPEVGIGQDLLIGLDGRVLRDEVVVGEGLTLGLEGDRDGDQEGIAGPQHQPDQAGAI